MGVPIFIGIKSGSRQPLFQPRSLCVRGFLLMKSLEFKEIVINLNYLFQFFKEVKFQLLNFRIFILFLSLEPTHCRSINVPPMTKAGSNASAGGGGLAGPETPD